MAQRTTENRGSYDPASASTRISIVDDTGSAANGATAAQVGAVTETAPAGEPYSTGISYAITKLYADSDTTVVVADDVYGSLVYV